MLHFYCNPLDNLIKLMEMNRKEWRIVMLGHILISIPVVLAFILIAIRSLGIDTLTVGGHTWKLSVEQSAKGASVTALDVMMVVLWALFLRVFIYWFTSYICPLFGMEDTSNVSSLWANWDGTHYLKLAELGYDGYIEDGKHLFLVFFPLYPWLIRALHLLIPNYTTCAYIISYGAFAGGCAYFYCLVAKEYSKKIAFRGILLLSLFPFSFFFGAVRTESLFFLTSMASLYYIRKHKFLTASIWGALAALTRMHGLLLIIPALVEILTYYKPFRMLKEKNYKDFWSLMLHKVLCLPVVAVGTIIYLLLNYRTTGNPFQFLIHQKEHWSQGSQYFSKTVETIYNQIQGTNYTTDRILWIPQLVLFFFALAVLIYGIRRVSAVYSAYFFVYMFMNYSITWPLSCGRYMTCAIPMFLILAEGSRRHNRIYQTLLIIFTMFMTILLPLFLQSKHLY